MHALYRGAHMVPSVACSHMHLIDPRPTSAKCWQVLKFSRGSPVLVICETATLTLLGCAAEGCSKGAAIAATLQWRSKILGCPCSLQPAATACTRQGCFSNE